MSLKNAYGDITRQQHSAGLGKDMRTIDDATQERQPLGLYALSLEGLWQKDSSIHQGHCLLDGFQHEQKFPVVTTVRR